jgi:hypothetical protein
MVPKIEETKLTVKMLGMIAGILLGILGALASMFVFIDGRYVNEDVYELHVTQNDEDLAEMDEKTALIISAMQSDYEQDLNRVYKAIKDASALPLIVRRDLLQARFNSLSPVERNELTILNTKLDELNIED